MSDIVDRLRDLHRQATTERSHYYTAKVVQDAADEIERLRRRLNDAEDIMRGVARHLIVVAETKP